MQINNMALIIFDPTKPATERRKIDRRRRRRESVPWERSDLVSETPVHTHPRYCDTAFMSAPAEHKPTGLVSGSQCPREQSPSAETKRGWLRRHLHHKGKPFSTWTTACAPRCTSHLSATLDPRDICLLFFCPSLSPPLPFFLSGPHRLSTMAHINSRSPSPSLFGGN